MVHELEVEPKPSSCALCPGGWRLPSMVTFPSAAETNPVEVRRAMRAGMGK